MKMTDVEIRPLSAHDFLDYERRMERIRNAGLHWPCGSVPISGSAPNWTFFESDWKFRESESPRPLYSWEINGLPNSTH